MKRLTVLLAAICFLLINLTAAQAWVWGKKAETKPAATQEPAAAAKPKETAKPVPVDQAEKAREEAFKAKRAIAQKKLNELNNSEWAIELTSMNNLKAKKEMDTVTIKNSQVSIAGFAKKGFPTTNFTLTVQEDGTVIWETMQTSEKSGIAFWRGELDPKLQIMRGVVSHQIDKKNKNDFSFISTARKNIPAAK
jgi:hypothetical protein